jgi:hypothetical protein
MRKYRKLTSERADAINRKRDLLEGTDKSIETDTFRVRPGRIGIINENHYIEDLIINDKSK